ncbi:hypothetical protein CGRA01v4_06478 [Colletotrichum graminicola]|uniref:Uncharacterized protein n=1 Tax=Colletotrichum graminicola (strain M1.001 / M2 / FGSC 10212) TaxID=645133 RepID=E3Q282_COLGM|nr:uncharacterized protein GLRG_00327 [Colletotrichum graminicola M1.001]EFQ25183.1 hypothetical protein GLRG_00327 [Colletotrichum graminicola M1.001]WDK15197.1 hypothetical protein CGRA01v4_06478 [Colletotrichum graminicola]
MAGKHRLPTGLSDIPFSPVHKKRRIVKQSNPWDDVDDAQGAQGSQPKTFTKDDADALYHQVEDFEKDYRKESCRVYTDTPPREVELRITRVTLYRRSRSIRHLLHRTFFPDASLILRPSAEAYHTLTAHRAALTRHQALWHHRRARRRTLRASRALALRTATFVAAEAAHDADAEHDPNDPRDPSRHRVAFAQRRRWYRTVKRDMRRRGQWVSRAAPGPGVEWEPFDVHGDPGARVSFFEPVAGDWILPAHVRDARDLDVFLNQLGLRFTPVEIPLRDRPWA